MTFALATFDALSAVHAVPALAWVHFDVIAHVRHWMHAAGYPVLFGLLLSCGLGLPLPEDVPLLLAGFFVAKGEMSLVPAAVCAWCGIIGGDCILYSFGRRFGMGIVHVPVIGSHIRTEQIERLHEQFEKYGWWVVAVGRLFAGVRGAMVLVAGTIRFTFSHFLIADGIAAIFSGGMFLGLGYYAGRKLGDLAQIHEAIERYSLRVLVVLIGVGLIAVVWMYWRKRRRRADLRGPGVNGATERSAGDVPAVDANPHEAVAPPVTAAAAESPGLPPG